MRINVYSQELTAEVIELSKESNTGRVYKAAQLILHSSEHLHHPPEDVRVGSWVKPFAAFKANVTRAWAWEPVIFRFSRPRTREQATWRDFVSAPITMRRGFPGAKPDAFCYWIFEGLNLVPDDQFDDVFPGSGAVGSAWEKWCAAQHHPEQQLLLQAV